MNKPTQSAAPKESELRDPWITEIFIHKINEGGKASGHLAKVLSSSMTCGCKLCLSVITDAAFARGKQFKLQTQDESERKADAEASEQEEVAFRLSMAESNKNEHDEAEGLDPFERMALSMESLVGVGERISTRLSSIADALEHLADAYDEDFSSDEDDDRDEAGEDVRRYDTALSPQQIKKLYEEETTAKGCEAAIEEIIKELMTNPESHPSFKTNLLQLCSFANSMR